MTRAIQRDSSISPIYVAEFRLGAASGQLNLSSFGLERWQEVNPADTASQEPLAQIGTMKGLTWRQKVATLRRIRTGWVLVLVALLFVGGAGYIGYFGGPLYFEIPARASLVTGRPRVAAVLFSGDMGFRLGMGPAIASRLADDGIPVLGVSSLSYFRKERSPAEVRALVQDAMRRAFVFGRADRLVLIGQSFGADMLHVGAVGLPEDLRRRVQLVVLVVPGKSVFYRVSPGEMFDWTRPDAEALPTALRLDWAPVVCIRGAEEANSLCPRLHLPNVDRIVLPGGHPMHHDANRLYAAIASAIASTDAGRANH
ncbi:MAG TPA: AcvB/VirJ family lysyl-phosphatidylglycerol hydrolase [Novosphingobium sp.]